MTNVGVEIQLCDNFTFFVLCMFVHSVKVVFRYVFFYVAQLVLFLVHSVKVVFRYVIFYIAQLVLFLVHSVKVVFRYALFLLHS